MSSNIAIAQKPLIYKFRMVAFIIRKTLIQNE